MLLLYIVKDAILLLLGKRAGLYPLPGTRRGDCVAVVHVQPVEKRSVYQVPQLLASDRAL